MKLAFAEISQEQSHYSLSEVSWFPADELVCCQPVLAEFEVCKKTNKTVHLKGVVRFTALLACDRCGVPVESRIQEEFEYILTLEEQNNPEMSELECSTEDCNTLYLKDPVIDLDMIFREQVLLAVPVRTLCAEDCQGLCSVCGALLKNENCDCSTSSSNSPFAVLKRLRKA